MAALYLFPVPLDNNAPLERSLPAYNTEILREIKHFIVENVRSARRFLKKCDRSIDIDSLEFTVLDEHTAPADVPAMLRPLEEGHSMGVISEAGCPAVADPGADVVALMASGFNGQSFAFNGYLPIHQPQRGAKLKEMERRILRERQTQIFIETPYRNNRLIAELVSALPPSMKLCVASGITGEAERIVTLPLSRWGKEKYDFDKIPTIFLLFG